MGKETERKTSEIRELSAGEILRSMQGIKNLSQALDDEMNRDPNANWADITAGLHTVEALSRAAREVLEASGGVIFSRNGSIEVQSSSQDLDAGADLYPEPVEKKMGGPKTSGELLSSRIDDFLPEGQKSFDGKSLSDIFGNKLGIKKAIFAEGFKDRKRFLRKDAVKIAQRFLVTPHGQMKKREFWTRVDLLSSFSDLKAHRFDELIAELNFDWNQNPTVDNETAIEIRGLVFLDKLASRRDNQN